MTLIDQIIDSWNRQCAIVRAVTTRIDDQNRTFKPAEDSYSIDGHLAHMHHTRRYFLNHVAPEEGSKLSRSFLNDDGTEIADIPTLVKNLDESGEAVARVVSHALQAGGNALSGEHVIYDHPILLMQHLVWHEGWHVGQIMLALRVNGQEPAEEWEEAEMWGNWRTRDLVETRSIIWT